MNYASRWQRLLGQMIDGFIGGLPLMAAGAIGYNSTAFGSVLLIVGVLWSCFNYFFADGMDGQSFAKRWLGMQVISEATGRPCTYWSSFVRNVTLLLGPIDWIFIIGEKRQRLGDKLAGTIVILD